MKQKLLFTFIALIGMFFTGCAQKVGMKALEPAEVDRVAYTKKWQLLTLKMIE